MPYMGKVDVKASDIKRFSVTGSTSATHALSWTAPSEQALIITINGVKQQDGAYTIAGTPTTITLSSALVATDEMEVIGINDIGQTNTVAQDSIVTNMIRDDAVTTAKIADDQITSAKLASAINITSGNSLTIDSGATITNNGTGSGFGKILNVWHALQTTSASVGNTTTYQNISQLYFTVTPQSTNSKFYMSYHWSGDNLTQGTGYGAMACFRDSTNIGGKSLVEVGVVMMSGSAYDAPATTSSITYRPKVWYNGATVNYGGAQSSPSFFLMEVDG